MRPPAVVEIVGQRFDVNLVDRYHEKLVSGEPDLPNLGTCILSEQAIYLRAGLGDDQLRDTFLHEVIHGCLRVMGVELDDENEERVAAALGPVLLDVLRRNGELVRYLVTP